MIILRQYAIDKIDDSMDDSTRNKVVEGINNALYGVMMIIDGVSGQLENSEYAVTLQTIVSLIRKSDMVERKMSQPGPVTPGVMPMD